MDERGAELRPCGNRWGSVLGIESAIESVGEGAEVLRCVLSKAEAVELPLRLVLRFPSTVLIHCNSGTSLGLRLATTEGHHGCQPAWVHHGR